MQRRSTARNYALAADPVDGETVLHRADCPYVRKLAEAGHPVFTMFDCEKEPTTDIVKRWHSCMRDLR